jgi:hypothetical protein
VLFCGFLCGVLARGGQARLRDSPVRLHCCRRGGRGAAGAQLAKSNLRQFRRLRGGSPRGDACRLPNTFIWHIRCTRETRFTNLERGASTQCCAGGSGNTVRQVLRCSLACSCEAPEATWRRSPRRSGYIPAVTFLVARVPRHPTLRWCRVSWSPCALKACDCAREEAHNLIGMGAERHRNRAGLRRNAASRHPRVAATGRRLSIGRGVSTSRQAAAKVEVASRQSWSTREVRAANPFEEPWTLSQLQ